MVVQTGCHVTRGVVIEDGVATAQATPGHLGQLLAGLPARSVWTGAGFGERQLPMNVLGLLYGQGARVGLEDTPWFDADRRIPATNEQLVERVVGLAGSLGRRVASRPEVRETLGLPAR